MFKAFGGNVEAIPAETSPEASEPVVDPEPPAEKPKRRRANKAVAAAASILAAVCCLGRWLSVS